MQGEAGMRVVLEALGEPAMITDMAGRIACANVNVASCFGRKVEQLTEICASTAAADALLAYLRRCSGVAQPLPGAVTLRIADGRLARFRTSCAALKAAAPGGSRMVLLRLAQGGDDRFTTLAGKIHELNQEIRDRRRSQLRLEVTLQERDLLLRELHHRVKNNIHLLTGILRTAQRESAGRDAGRVLEDVTQRLASVAAVHQLLHLEGSVATIRCTDFIAKVAALVLQAAGQGHRLALDVQEADLPNDMAVPLALILNELLTNAVKYAAWPDARPCEVRISLATNSEGELELVVADDGPGFRLDDVSLRRGSGLGLVKGLAGQIGGSFAVRPRAGSGMECIVRFRDRMFHAAAGR